MLLIIVACFFCVSCVNDNDKPNPGGNNGGGSETPQKKEVDIWKAGGLEGTYFPSENYYQSLWGKTEYYHNYAIKNGEKEYTGFRKVDWKEYKELSGLLHQGINICNRVFNKNYDIHKIHFSYDISYFPHVTYVKNNVFPIPEAYAKFYAIDSITFDIKVSTIGNDIVYQEENELNMNEYVTNWEDEAIYTSYPTPKTTAKFFPMKEVLLETPVNTNTITISVSVIDLKIKEGYEDMAPKQEFIKYYQETLSANIMPYTYI